MALVNVNADPQPGDAGYYDWHDNVAAANNKLKAALDAAANGDLIGADANNEPKAIPSGTYRKAIASMNVVNVAERYGETVADLESAIAEAAGTSKPLYIDPASAITGSGEAVDFAGVPKVLAWGATMVDIRAFIGDTEWWGGTIEQVNNTSQNPLVEFKSNARVYGLDSKPLNDASYVAFVIRGSGGVQESNINLSHLRDMRKGSAGAGRASFEIRDCRDVVIRDYYARPSGNHDDGLVIKATEAATHDVLIDGAVINDYVLFGTGDDCEAGIDNIVARNLVGIRSPGLRIRAGQDTRPGGHVRNLDVQATIYDRDGVILAQPVLVAVKADGDARIDDVDIHARVIGRFKSSTQSDREPVTVTTASGSKGIGRVTIAGSYVDPYEGAPNDASNPGWPAWECTVRARGGQSIDHVTFDGWKGSHFRSRAIFARADGDAGEQVKLCRVLNPVIDVADMDSGGVGWIDHNNGGELEVTNPTFGPTAPADPIRARNGSTRRAAFYAAAAKTGIGNLVAWDDFQRSSLGEAPSGQTWQVWGGGAVSASNGWLEFDTAGTTFTAAVLDIGTLANSPDERVMMEVVGAMGGVRRGQGVIWGVDANNWVGAFWRSPNDGFGGTTGNIIALEMQAGTLTVADDTITDLEPVIAGGIRQIRFSVGTDGNGRFAASAQPGDVTLAHLPSFDLSTTAKFIGVLQGNDVADMRYGALRVWKS